MEKAMSSLASKTVSGGGRSGAQSTRAGLPVLLGAGTLGGLVAGMVFGMMMQMMGRIEMVAKLVGSNSPLVGWVVHLAISVVFGLGFTVAAGRFLNALRTALLAGAMYGAVLWVLGPLLLMPARLGMPLFQIDAGAAMSMMGHLIFGLVLGAVAWTVARRAASSH